MSIKVMTIVWDKFPASGSELLAMLALADWCSDDGSSLHPSMQAVGRKIRVSEKQARRIVQGFVDDGYLEVIGNQYGGKPGTTKQFKLNVQKLASLPELTPKKPRTTPSRVTPPLDVTPPILGIDPSHPCPSTPPTGGSLTVIEPLIEPLVIGERAQAPAATPPAADAVLPEDPPAPTPPAPPPPPPAPAPAPEETKPKRKTGYPADFEPDTTAVDMAHNLRLNIAAEQAHFADHHCANGSTMLDWQAAFRTWLRNAAKFAQKDAARIHGPLETTYQRTMREKVEKFAPSVAKRAPEAPQAPRQSAADFFRTVDVQATLKADARALK